MYDVICHDQLSQWSKIVNFPIFVAKLKVVFKEKEIVW